MSDVLAREYLPWLEDIEHDGRTLQSPRDPPGQHCVYIPPGDPERESYRISTYSEFPSQVPVNPLQLASSGFVYTGYKDRVKCYSCGMAVDNWTISDDPTLPRWHRHDCMLILGTCPRNVHLGADSRFNRIAADSLSGSSQPQSSYHRMNPVESDLTIQVRIPFQQLVPQSVSSSRSIPSFCDTYPCLHPINPHMRTTEGRLQTFLDNSSIWPAHRIRATPQQIVDAGMYYLGERDRVKCWYCNGGLQNWERDDDPWEEHAKWFPLCEYVLQRKGPDYVNQIVLRFPGLRRPTLTNPASAASTSRPTSHNSSPLVIDPQQEREEAMRKVARDMQFSSLVADAKLLGFSNSVIENALKNEYLVQKRPFPDLSSLANAILEADDESIETTETSVSNSERNLSPNEELQEMEESRRCKRCHREEACVVFIPCGHLACCVACSNQIKKCSLCRVQIREKVRSYLS